MRGLKNSVFEAKADNPYISEDNLLENEALASLIVDLRKSR
jgi:hypothetical protein